MMPLVRRFCRRSPAERRLLVQALAAHIAVALAIRLVDFRRVKQWFDRGAPAPDRSDPQVVDRILWAVRTATTLVPLGRSCLTEALTARWLLRQHGGDATVCFGVARGPDRALVAHAWLEHRGRTIIGGSADRPYTILRPVRRNP